MPPDFHCIQYPNEVKRANPEGEWPMKATGFFWGRRLGHSAASIRRM